MTDHRDSPNTVASPSKRSLSPDEGEIIEDVKRRRESTSPPTNSRRSNEDGRLHRVVYDNGGSGGGYDYGERSRYRVREYEDSRRYGDKERRYEHAPRSPHWDDRRDKQYSSQYHHSERSRRPYSPSRHARRNRSVSSEPMHDRSPSRGWTTSPKPPSSLNTRTPSPRPKRVQFSSGTKPPASHASGATGSMTASPAPPPVDLTVVDDEALIEARRRKREAILAKYMDKPTAPAIDNLKMKSTESSPAPGSPSVKQDSPYPGSRDSTPDFEADDGKAFELISSTNMSVNMQLGTSAADYDPTYDMRLDNERRQQHDHKTHLDAVDYDETETADQLLANPQESPPDPPQPKTPVDEDEDDMFATPVSPKSRPTKTEANANKTVPVVEARQLDASLLDVWTDKEGYYNVFPGELLNKRYVVQSSLGKGVFSSVVRCVDNERNGRLVAIKFLRNNDAIRKAGLKEIGILEKIQEADPDGRKHIIRLEGWFEHNGHLCLVFENLSLNLREVLKRFGRDVGINLRAVRAYAQQMFVGLSHLRKCHILHADLKPDNILISENRTTLKLCDLGSASDISENAITPYLVSRFYRSPEIILGLPYDYAIDTWSIGCTLFELYTGKILFPGRSNNQMLRLMMECRGRFPTKMLRKGQLVSQHFNEQLVFMSQEVDPVTKKDVVKPLNIQRPLTELKQRILVGSSVLEAEAALLSSFVDLLGRCLELNPEKRITPAEAFRHPFIKV